MPNIASLTHQYLSDPRRITRMDGDPKAYLESRIKETRGAIERSNSTTSIQTRQLYDQLSGYEKILAHILENPRKYDTLAESTT